MSSKADLMVHCLTCTNETNGLFDFESKGLVKQTFKLKPRDEEFKWAMYMLDNKIHLLEDNLSNDFATDNPSACKILRLSYTSNEFHIQSPEDSDSPIPDSNIIWIVHSDSILRKFNCKNRRPINSHSLTENDVLKFGRIELSVKCIIMGTDVTTSDLNLKGLGFINPDNHNSSDNLSNSNNKNNNDRCWDSNGDNIPPFDCPTDPSHMEDTQPAPACDFDDLVDTGRPVTGVNGSANPSDPISNGNGSDPSKLNKYSSSKSFGPKVCRICLCDDSELGPLVAPCNCKGSLNYVHLWCLRTWIKGRLSNAKEDDASFFWKELACELCGIRYPSVLNINDIETNLMDIKRPDTPYVVLEMRSNSDGGCFVVSVAKNKAIIGREHESDVRLTDISVSRMHASLQLDDGKIVVQDRQSKFGTLVRANPPFSIPIKGPICLQIGRSTILINVKDSWSLKWPSCLRADNISEKNNINNLEPVN